MISSRYWPKQLHTSQTKMVTTCKLRQYSARRGSQPRYTRRQEQRKLQLSSWHLQEGFLALKGQSVTALNFEQGFQNSLISYYCNTPLHIRLKLFGAVGPGGRRRRSGRGRGGGRGRRGLRGSSRRRRQADHRPDRSQGRALGEGEHVVLQRLRRREVLGQQAARREDEAWRETRSNGTWSHTQQ